jgi:uncharacterized protein (AIM24 family)
MENDMSYSIADFVERTAQDSAANNPFELENDYLLEINLNGRAWAKAGAMIAYTGQVKFTREGMLEHGVGKALKKMVSGEGTSLMKVEGQGRVYLADKGKKVQVLNLQNETIFVNGNDLLAFESSVNWDIKMMRRMAGLMAGGLFNVRLSGPGMVAITTHYDPLTLQVKPGQTIYTDPNATVAWSGSLMPDFRTDVSFKTFLGRGSGESIQLKFEGSGWVVLQPFEEVYFQSSKSSS